MTTADDRDYCDDDHDPCLDCSLCCETLRAAVELKPCRHYLCKRCYDYGIKTCPLCRVEIKSVSPIPTLLQVVIAALPRKCLSCPWKGPASACAGHVCVKPSSVTSPSKDSKEKAAEAASDAASEKKEESAASETEPKDEAENKDDTGAATVKKESEAEASNSKLHDIEHYRHSAGNVSKRLLEELYNAGAASATMTADEFQSQLDEVNVSVGEGTLTGAVTVAAARAALSGYTAASHVTLYWDFDSLPVPKNKSVPATHQAVMSYLKDNGHMASTPPASKDMRCYYTPDHKYAPMTDTEGSLLRAASVETISCPRGKDTSDRQLKTHWYSMMEKHAAQPDQQLFVLISNSEDYCGMVKLALERKFRVVVVHDASPGSGHEALLQMFPSSNVKLRDLLGEYEPRMVRPTAHGQHGHEVSALGRARSRKQGTVTNYNVDHHCGGISPDGHGKLSLFFRGDALLTKKVTFVEKANPNRPGTLMADEVQAVGGSALQLPRRYGRVTHYDAAKHIGGIEPDDQFGASLFFMGKVQRGTVVSFIAKPNPLKRGEYMADDVQPAPSTYQPPTRPDAPPADENAPRYYGRVTHHDATKQIGGIEPDNQPQMSLFFMGNHARGALVSFVLKPNPRKPMENMADDVRPAPNTYQPPPRPDLPPQPQPRTEEHHPRYYGRVVHYDADKHIGGIEPDNQPGLSLFFLGNFPRGTLVSFVLKPNPRKPMENMADDVRPIVEGGRHRGRGGGR